jgi:hypothetical protein
MDTMPIRLEILHYRVCEGRRGHKCDTEFEWSQFSGYDIALQYALVKKISREQLDAYLKIKL